MLSLSTGDLISINRSCLTATGISVALYSYASKYESNTRKAGIIKDVAIVLMIYTLICLISLTLKGTKDSRCLALNFELLIYTS